MVTVSVDGQRRARSPKIKNIARQGLGTEIVVEVGSKDSAFGLLADFLRVALRARIYKI